MKARNPFVLVVACVLLLTGQPIASQLQPRDAAPYLMAFSTDPSPHFVIERADGTDSRTFAVDVMAADTNQVSGAGWSPSGRWFAWTAGAYYDVTDTGMHPFVLSVDGQTRLTALDGLHRTSLHWSPNEDILLVAGLLHAPEIVLDPQTQEFTTINDADTLTMRIGLLDPATDSFLQVQDLPAPFARRDLLSASFQLRWPRDAAHGLALARVSEEDTASPTIRSYRIGMAGDFAVTDYEAGSLLRGEFNLAISPNGELAAFLPPNSVQIMSAAGALTDIAIPPTSRILNAWWSSEGEYLLVHSQLEYPESSTESPDPGLWVWSRGSSTVTQLFDGQSIEGHTELERIVPAPDFSGVFFIVNTNRSRTAHYASMDGTIMLDLGDTSSSIPPVLNSTGQIAVVLEGDTGEIGYVVYDVSGDTTLQIGAFTAPGSYITPALSPGGQMVGFIENEVNLIQVSSGETLVLPPDSRRYFAADGGEMEWHSAGEWVLLREQALVAGGGYLRYTGVVKTDGSVRMPVGYCESVSPRCLEWLPPQVNPASLAPGEDRSRLVPITTIDAGDWIDDLVWSPDASQIASGGDWRLEGEAVPFVVWQLETGAPVSRLEPVSWEETVGWEDGVPQIIPRHVDARDSEPRTLTVSADGTRSVQIRHSDGIWLDLVDADGNRTVSLPDFVNDWRLSGSFSPDGRYLAISSASNTVKILDAQTGDVVAELPLIYSKAVAFSPDGVWLAVAEGTVIQIYAVEDILGE